MTLSVVGAYLAGLWLGPFLSLFPLSLLGALLSFGLILTWCEQRGSLSRWAGVLLFAGLVAGVGQAHWATVDNLESPFASFWGTKHPVTLQGAIAAPVRLTPDGMILLVDVERSISNGNSLPLQGRIRLTWREPDFLLVYGNQVSVTARLREPYGTLNPGGFHYGKYLKQKGIQAVATVSGPQAVQVQTSDILGVRENLFGLVDTWRQAIHHAATTSLSNPALGLFLGMIIGEQSYIEQDIRDAFMATGTVHILSISGSHLGLLAFVVFFVVKGSISRLPADWLERISLYLTATQISVLVTQKWTPIFGQLDK